MKKYQTKAQTVFTGERPKRNNKRQIPPGENAIFNKIQLKEINAMEIGTVRTQSAET